MSLLKKIESHPRIGPLAFRIKYFSPAWFAASMGIGITASILHQFPFQARWLRVAGIIVWGLNIGVLSLFLVCFILRFICYPSQFMRMLHHPGQSAFLGCLPMALATTINMIQYIFGNKGWKAAYVLWWIDVALSLMCTWGVVFLMFSIHKRSSEAINATILLPVVPVVVAAATGGVIAVSLPEGLQASTLIVSFMIWANGQMLAFCCIAIYTMRLFTHALPPQIMILSSLLPVGPLGQGAFGIQCMADLFVVVLGRSDIVSQSTLDAIHYAGIVIALFLIGFGTFWMVLGFLAAAFSRPNTFHMSWWSLTFPIGTYVVAWYKLGEELKCVPFDYIGAVLGVFVIIAVCICSLGSIRGAIFSDVLFKHAASETEPKQPAIEKRGIV